MAFVPTPSTWEQWNGFTTGTVNYSANTETYRVCDNDGLIDLDVTVVLESITKTIDTVDGNTRTKYKQNIKAVISNTVTSNVIVFAQAWRRSIFQTCQDIDDQDFTAQFDTPLTIFSSSTESATFEFDLDEVVEYTPCPFEQQWSFSTDANQGSIPSCNPASTCTLEITGSTTVTPTLRGGTNGSISVFVSGSTGTTNYSINGGTPQVSNTFTGLAAGSYSILAEEDSCYDSLVVVLNDGEFRTSDFTVTEPAEFVAVENPIITTLNTANNLVAQFSKTSFTFDSGLTNNYSVSFNLTSPTAYVANFTAKDFPNKDNYFVTTELKDRDGTSLGTNTVNEIATTFGEAIQKDINLSRWYFVSVVDNVVSLTAKEARSSMDLTASNVDVLDENGDLATIGIVLTQITAGQDPFEGSLVDDYSLYTDIYIGDGTTEYGEVLSAQTYNNYISLILPFNSVDNIHQFDGSQVIKNFVSTSKIDMNFTGFTVLPEMIRNFYVKYGEKYPLVANENTKKKRDKGQIDYKWSINSALAWENANDMSQYFTGGTFLTNSPPKINVERDQINFLYFILIKDYGQTLTLKGDIQYYDGQTATEHTFINIASGSTNVGGVYGLATSYDALGLSTLESNAGSKIKKIDFAVHSTSAITETKTYNYNFEDLLSKFGVAFQNKLGTYDTFDFLGIVENSINRSNKLYVVPRDINADGSSSEGFKTLTTYDTKVTKTLTVNSGWLNEATFDWLIELLSSNNIYSYTEEYQNYLNVGGYTYTKNTNENTYNLEIQFVHNIIENTCSV